MIFAIGFALAAHFQNTFDKHLSLYIYIHMFRYIGIYIYIYIYVSFLYRYLYILLYLYIYIHMYVYFGDISSYRNNNNNNNSSSKLLKLCFSSLVWSLLLPRFISILLIPMIRSRRLLMQLLPRLSWLRHARRTSFAALNLLAARFPRQWQSPRRPQVLLIQEFIIIRRSSRLGAKLLHSGLGTSWTQLFLMRMFGLPTFQNCIRTIGQLAVWCANPGAKLDTGAHDDAVISHIQTMK